MPERQMTDQEKEDLRKDELEFLKSAAVKSLYTAAQGRSVAQYGEQGEAVTSVAYLRGLDSNDKHVGRLTTKAFARTGAEQAQLGKDPRKYGAALPADLLDTADASYQAAIAHVKVSDVIELLGIKGVHEKRISKDQMNMYMGDFAKANPQMYQELRGTYLSTTADEGVFGAGLASVKARRGGLEKVLQSDPDAQNQ